MTGKTEPGERRGRSAQKRGRGEDARGARGREGRQRTLRETKAQSKPKPQSAPKPHSKNPAPGKTGVRNKTAEAKTGPGAAELQLDSFLPYRLSVLNNMVSRALAEQYQARFGLSIPEWRVMANLGRAAPMSANEVAERTSMDKVKVSRAISRMQSAGLLKRETDPRDHRVSSLKLSARGKRIYDKIAPMALAWEQEFLSVLSEREIAAFDKILAKLDKRIRE
ncbi:MarR family winged helix-turn-helix transcriptional regulator [Denitrobaculum tricleocarpae]|nr:MarR family winged helix-turn-helix transcriptional regulator [Denitrobaculum tricleocarpae]